MSAPRYSPWVRVLHWLMFVVIAAALAFGYLHSWAEKGSEIRAFYKWLHVQFGVVSLVLMVFRVIFLFRSRRQAPPITPPLSELNQKVLKVGHATLYALLVVVPILGLIFMYMRGSEWDFLSIAMPFNEDGGREVSRSWKKIHEQLGELFMYLIGLHAAISLWHHFVRKDDSLRRMLPGGRIHKD